MADNEHTRQLLALYPAAITDFFGSGTLCIYKTGPAWPVARPNAQKLIRAARPYYNPKKAETWVQTLHSIRSFLESLDIQFTAVDPLAYANAGEAAVFCDFVLVVSVNPRTLVHGDAVATASGVIAILERAGFSDPQVAFVEAVYRRRQAKSMGFDPNAELEAIARLRKPFSPSLGLSIARLNTPQYEGTGGVLLRLKSDPTDKRVFLLTCAHVARPPAVFPTEAYTRKQDTQPREDVVLLGSAAFNESVGDIAKLIEDETDAIAVWESSLSRIPARTDNEPSSRTDRRDELVSFINKAKKTIVAANELHTAVTESYTSTGSRVLGFVYHCAKIGVGEDGYMYDWALIQLDADKLEAASFQGNKLYVGGSKTAADWQAYMFPQPHDSRDFYVPDDLLLQLKDYVPEDEFHDPQHYDTYDVKTLLAVKNGGATGTTFGRVNGLESMTREYTEHGVKSDAFEVAVLGYDTKTAKNERFSGEGDSGAMVVDRLGRPIGPITGGGGTADATDKSYVTPYHKLKKEIEREFEDAHLLSRNAWMESLCECALVLVAHAGDGTLAVVSESVREHQSWLIWSKGYYGFEGDTPAEIELEFGSWPQ